MGQTRPSYHAFVDEISSMLVEHGIDYEFFEHEPVRTSEEAAAARPGYSLRQGAKAMVLRIRESGIGKRFALFVLPEGGLAAPSIDIPGSEGSGCPTA